MATPQAALQPEEQGVAQAVPETAKPQDDEVIVGKVSLAGMKIIQAKMQNIVTILKSADPAEGLAMATFLVMRAVFEAWKGTLPPKAFLPAVQVVMPFLAELGEATGAAKADEALVKKAAEIFLQKIKAEAGNAQTQGAPQSPVAQEAAPPVAPAGPGLIAQGMGA